MLSAVSVPAVVSVRSQPWPVVVSVRLLSSHYVGLYLVWAISNVVLQCLWKPYPDVMCGVWIVVIHVAKIVIDYRLYDTPQLPTAPN